EDVRKIKAYCQANNKKFYVTVNTLVTNSELKDVSILLKQLEYLNPDGLIVQDLGIAKLIRKSFPSLPLHGSTQLAVHTINGVKELQALGFSRVVLSRELSFDEIKAIRKACPDVELKVFIHGALCYGFSGLCMASQFITGNGHDRQDSRSANRGSCAQICRTWFHCSETGTDSWLFSMKDLCLGEKVNLLAQAGVDSLKVEGRMKGPDYAYWCARYYRLILDGHNEKEQEVQWAKEAMQISFSRDTTEYFFNTGSNGSTNCQNMVCASDPGHKGVPVGTIDKVLPNGKAVVRFTRPVAIRDGLKVHGVGFSLRDIEGGKSFISEHEVATINFPSDDFEKRPGFGTPVYCISRHNLNMSQINENIPLYKRPIDIGISILPSSITVNGMSFPIDVQEAKSASDTNQILTKVFDASDKSYFTLGRLSATNNSGFDNPFLPMSVMKQIRRSFYESLDQAFEKEISIPVEIPPHAPASLRNDILPSRIELGLWDQVVNTGKGTFMSLSPVMFNESEYLDRIERQLEDDSSVIVGLNNIAQVRWVAGYLKSHPDFKAFADVFLYTENTLAYDSLKEELPCLIGSYELDRDTPFNYTGDTYTPPVFISRVCMRHNGLGLSCGGCGRNNTFHLEQNGKHYKALCKDCITIVTKE
ncbi:MAG: DUF3656 domain-containing protein, partial [Spirochaetales bacterium]|nr:DUF3656 domain-containing protein [Spirochaetales bacterium]